MNKILVNGLFFLVFMVFSSISKATLITNLSQAELDTKNYSNAEDHLTSDLLDVNYITYKGYDWAWVSPVNLESIPENTLYAPELQKNWLFADDTLLNIIKNELTLADFTNENGEIIQAVQFFNSEYTHVDTDDFNSGFLSSAWTLSGSFMTGILKGQETFYVRAVSTDPTPKPIPEPLSIFIFASALIALQIKLRSKAV